MYVVTVGEEMIRVSSKQDAMKLVNILFGLDCDERISSKPLTMNEAEKEGKCEEEKEKK